MTGLAANNNRLCGKQKKVMANAKTPRINPLDRVLSTWIALTPLRNEDWANADYEAGAQQSIRCSLELKCR